ncbi:MAG: hypothetical protein KDD82_21125 [Planctomycetes bacterium]|nr:hypothetical protein [Planctomycetota bacterium]
MSLRLTFVLCLIALPFAGAKDCGELPTGQNPSPEELSAEIALCSARHQVPTEVIKAVGWQESGLQQWRPDGTFVYNTSDCGLGMMQLTGDTAKQFDLEQLKRDWRYNLDAGVKVLAQKWERAVRQKDTPPDPAARRVLENWYYAIAYYYGGKNEDYLRKIYGHLKDRPGTLSRILSQPVEVTLPSDVIPGFAFGDGFQAFDGNRFEDKDGKPHQGATHASTFGDPRTEAALEALIAKAQQAIDKGKVKNALKYLRKVGEVDYDSAHKRRAEAMALELVSAAEASLIEAERLHAAGELTEALKLLRKVSRDFKDHPLEDQAKERIKAYKVKQ